VGNCRRCHCRKLNEIKEKKGKIVLLTPTIISPSTKTAIAIFMQAFPDARHIQYDVASANGILKANGASFGREFIPSYRFDKAGVIVSFDADFLGSWLSPVEYTRQYAENRKLTKGKKTMSRHIHFEGAMSLTGSNADQRIQIRPSQQQLVMATLLNEIRRSEGIDTIPLPPSPVDVTELAGELTANKGKSLVVCGSNETAQQLLANEINYLLGNFGITVETDVHLKTRQADDSHMDALVQEMAEGKIDALIIHDLNPAYDYPDNKKFSEGLQKTGLTVSLAVSADETSAMTGFVCPGHHYLESWNDFEVKTGHFRFRNPQYGPYSTPGHFRKVCLPGQGDRLTTSPSCRITGRKILLFNLKVK
jgi:hypothetical protein